MWFSKQSDSNEYGNEHTKDGLDSIVRCEVVLEKIQNDASPIILLDVRTPEEYKEKHLEHAHLVPLDQLSTESLERVGLSGMLDKEIIVYCRSGIRGATAHDTLKELGYINVKNMTGGLLEWEDAGYPFTEEGEYVATLEDA